MYVVLVRSCEAGFLSISLPVDSPRVGPFSLSSSCNRDDAEPVYYPGIEIDGYMPHRGDFAVVSQ